MTNGYGCGPLNDLFIGEAHYGMESHDIRMVLGDDFGGKNAMMFAECLMFFPDLLQA